MNLPDKIEGEPIRARYVGPSAPLQGKVGLVRDMIPVEQPWVQAEWVRASFDGGPWFSYMRKSFEMLT